MCHLTYKTCSHKAHEELHCLKQTMRWKKLLSLIKQSVILPLAGNILCMVFKIQKKSCDIATRGAARTFGEGLRRSTVAHFARKVRGHEYCDGQTRLKIQQSHAPEHWSCSLRVRGPHFASKVSYNAGAAEFVTKFRRQVANLMRDIAPWKVGCSKSQKNSARFWTK